jgi:hypothetical protein
MERVKEDGHGHCIIYPYENRTMKPVKIILGREKGDKGE